MPLKENLRKRKWTTKMKSMGGVSNEITVHSLVCRTTLAAPLNPSTLHRVRTTNQYWPHYRLWNICSFCMAQQTTWISIDFSTNLLPLSHRISACMGQGVKGVALLYLIFRARILGTQYHEMSLRIWHLNRSNFISYPILQRQLWRGDRLQSNKRLPIL